MTDYLLGLIAASLLAAAVAVPLDPAMANAADAARRAAQYSAQADDVVDAAWSCWRQPHQIHCRVVLLGKDRELLRSYWLRCPRRLGESVRAHVCEYAEYAPRLDGPAAVHEESTCGVEE